MATDEDIDLNNLEAALPPPDFEEAQRLAYYAARDGQAVGLYAILKNQALPEQKLILKTPFLDDDGQCCPPLVIAARNGHENVVKTLISKFDVDIESTGRVKFESHIIEGASPLWCASGAGHLPIVKFLVGKGADVNHTTQSNSSPLRAACFDGRVDIVKYLIEEGRADYNIANKFENTCLMIAAFNGHLNVVKYLLEAGMDSNVQAKCGATALHFAAEVGSLDIVKELCERGKSDSVKANNYGLIPLFCAAEHCQEEVFQYLYAKCSPLLSDDKKIDAFELLGASYANDKERYDLRQSYEYLYKAMKLRSDLEHPKKNIKTIEAYGNHQESETLTELELRKNLAHKLHMEGLAIRERVLGSTNPALPHPIIFRGAVFADSTDFDKCVSLWLHALLIKQENLTNTPITKDVLRFSQVFSQMIQMGVEIKFADFVKVLEATAKEIEENVKRLRGEEDFPDDKDVIKEDLESNMMTFLYLVVIFSKLGSPTKDDILHSMKIIHHVVADIKPKSVSTGRSLVHLAVDSQTPINDFHIRDIIRFPCAKTTKLLIEAGIDVQVMDNDGNTPLHLIVGYQRVVADFLTLHAIITSLVDAGAHVDVVNEEGKTPLAKASTGVAEIILKSQQKLSLKCLSAQAVKRHGLSYIGQVPATLEQFIRLHGP